MPFCFLLPHAISLHIPYHILLMIKLRLLESENIKHTYTYKYKYIFLGPQFNATRSRKEMGVGTPMENACTIALIHTYRFSWSIPNVRMEYI